MSTRFFLANFLPNISERDLEIYFREYGEVIKVEIKTKEDPLDPANVKRIAFVTLNISEGDIKYCINEVSRRKPFGGSATVSLAKESFLDRLERERKKESEASFCAQIESSSEKAIKPSKRFVNTHKKFADLVEPEVSSDLILIKKTATNSLHNGKIVIPSVVDATPIHVINKKQAGSALLDAKSTLANQKRKQSLLQKKSQFLQNKSAIHKALASVNTRPSKNISFSDVEANEKKKDIFAANDDEEESNESVDFKTEYLGKKGENLLQLQSKLQISDPRFKINATFVDDEFDGADECTPVAEKQPREENGTNERDWQIGILEEVVGQKIDKNHSNEDGSAKNRQMLRFDPSKSEHKKFLRETKHEDDNSEAPATKPNSKQQNKRKRIDEVAPPKVSKEVFYVVSDSLSQALKTRGDGFSILSMFGNDCLQREEKRESDLKEVSHEKFPLQKSLDRNAVNPFPYDSPSDSDDESVASARLFNAAEVSTEQTSKAREKMFIETFFIHKNDARLKEGAKFFEYEKELESIENYDKVRHRLKMLIKTKITKSKKQLLGARHKSKK